MAREATSGISMNASSWPTGPQKSWAFWTKATYPHSTQVIGPMWASGSTNGVGGEALEVHAYTFDGVGDLEVIFNDTSGAGSRDDFYTGYQQAPWPQDGAWHHVAVTINYNGLLKIYIDGVEQASTDISGGENIGQSASHASINEATSGDRACDQDIAELGVWDTELTASDVNDLAVNKYAPDLVKSSNLVWYSEFSQDPPVEQTGNGSVGSEGVQTTHPSGIVYSLGTSFTATAGLGTSSGDRLGATLTVGTEVPFTATAGLGSTSGDRLTATLTAGAASVEFVDSGSAYNSGTGISVPAPAGISDGDLMIVAVATPDANNGESWQAPAGWIKIDERTGAGTSGGGYSALYRMEYDSGDPGPWTFTHGASGIDTMYSLSAWSGHDSVDPIGAIDYDFNGYGTANQPTAPSITTTADNAVALFVGHTNYSSFFGGVEPSGYTVLEEVYLLGTAYKDMPIAGSTGSATFTTDDANSAWGAWHIEIKPAGAQTTTPVTETAGLGSTSGDRLAVTLTAGTEIAFTATAGLGSTNGDRLTATITAGTEIAFTATAGLGTASGDRLSSEGGTGRAFTAGLGTTSGDRLDAGITAGTEIPVSEIAGLSEASGDRLTATVTVGTEIPVTATAGLGTTSGDRLAATFDDGSYDPVTALTNPVVVDFSNLSSMTINADGTGGSPSDTDYVGQVTDLGDTGYIFDADVSTERPQLDNTNGIWTLTGDGSDDALHTPTGLGLTGKAEFYVCFALRWTRFGWQAIFGANDSSGTKNGLSYVGSGGFTVWRNGNRMSGTASASDGELIVVEGWHTASELGVMIDGDPGRSQIVSGSFGSTYDIDGMTLFARPDGGGQSNTGMQGGVVLDYIPTESDRADIRSWAAGLQGRTLSVPTPQTLTATLGETSGSRLGATVAAGVDLTAALGETSGSRLGASITTGTEIPVSAIVGLGETSGDRLGANTFIGRAVSLTADIGDSSGDRLAAANDNGQEHAAGLGETSGDRLTATVAVGVAVATGLGETSGDRLSPELTQGYDTYITVIRVGQGDRLTADFHHGQNGIEIGLGETSGDRLPSPVKAGATFTVGLGTTAGDRIEHSVDVGIIVETFEVNYAQTEEHMLRDAAARFMTTLEVVGGPRFKGQISEAGDTTSIASFHFPRRILRVRPNALVKARDVIKTSGGQYFLLANHGDGFRLNQLYTEYMLFEMNQQADWEKRDKTVDTTTGLEKTTYQNPVKIWCVFEPITDLTDEIDVDVLRFRVITGAQLQLEDKLNGRRVRRVTSELGVTIAEAA